jgi:DNA-binding transcriptional regulator LsrR (DeoR family)
MEKKQEIQQAKKRRAKLLASFKKSGMTKVKFAAKHEITPQRLGQLLKMAEAENV